MNKEVNFEIAKLLQEKGFRLLPDFKSSYPTIADVITWLYEKHGIWVEVNYLPNVEKFAFIAKPLNFKKPKEFASYREYHNATKQFFSTEKYETPTEAYEAGIKHALTLKHLI